MRFLIKLHLPLSMMSPKRSQLIKENVTLRLMNIIQRQEVLDAVTMMIIKKELIFTIIKMMIIMTGITILQHHQKKLVLRLKRLMIKLHKPTKTPKRRSMPPLKRFNKRNKK